MLWPLGRPPGLVGAALGLGLYSATRVAYLAELRDRAARLERERDQQGALAAAAERARIAREMHDIVAHHLTAMVTLSNAAVAVSDSSPERSERATDVMRRVSATGRTALADTRRLLGVLRETPVERSADNGTQSPGGATRASSSTSSSTAARPTSPSPATPSRGSRATSRSDRAALPALTRRAGHFRGTSERRP